MQENTTRGNTFIFVDHDGNEHEINYMENQIDDNTVNANKTWSSSKIKTETQNTVNNALANYGNLNFVGTSYISNSLDNAKTVGNYRVGSDATSKPYVSAGYLSVLKRSDNLITQIFYGDNNLMAIRTFTTTWSNWKKLTTETDLVNYEKTDIGTSMGVNTTQTITLEQNCCLVFIRGYTSEGKGFYQLYLCSQITSLSNIQVYLLHSGGATNYTNIIISSNASDKITITTTNIAINRVKILYL